MAFLLQLLMELTACRAIGAGVSIVPYAFETPIDTYSNPKKASDADQDNDDVLIVHSVLSFLHE